jgi:hypothetical protein
MSVCCGRAGSCLEYALTLAYPIHDLFNKKDTLVRNEREHLCGASRVVGSG